MEELKDILKRIEEKEYNNIENFDIYNSIQKID